MATTTDYLNKLVTQKNTLADNLVTKGVDATHDETFETLVPKVLEISSGGGGGIYPIDNTGMPTGDVIVPDGVVTLSKIPFNANTNITSVSLPTSLTSISNNCFEDCTSLQNINIPSSVTAIPSHCFSDCTKLTTVPPDNINEYGNYAFYKCSNLPTINIPSNCTLIGEYAFAYCTKIKNITIDKYDSSRKYGSYCFAYCNSLTNDDICRIIDNADLINPSLFQSCAGITDVEVARVWASMFKDCKNLTRATVKGTGATGNTGISVFYGCTSLQEVQLAPTTKKIGTQIFYNCSALKTVFLPSTITEDTDSCLTSTSASFYAFYGCTALEDVQLGQDWNMSLRLNVSNNLTIQSMVAMFNSLKDLTGETAKTLTLGSTNLAKLTDEQKAIATNKNWTLA